MRITKTKKNNGNGTTARMIHIEFSHPTATAVAIAGTFNDWRPEATRMVALGEGRWIKELVLAPGCYEYLFVADGRWVPDPQARESVANPFGGSNSVLRVTGPSQARGAKGSFRGHKA
jgi:1,4-alpha-glucan branching enzyme